MKGKKNEERSPNNIYRETRELSEIVRRSKGISFSQPEWLYSELFSKFELTFTSLSRKAPFVR